MATQNPVKHQTCHPRPRLKSNEYITEDQAKPTPGEDILPRHEEKTEIEKNDKPQSNDQTPEKQQKRNGREHKRGEMSKSRTRKRPHF